MALLRPVVEFHKVIMFDNRATEFLTAVDPAKHSRYIDAATIHTSYVDSLNSSELFQELVSSGIVDTGVLDTNILNLVKEEISCSFVSIN